MRYVLVLALSLWLLPVASGFADCNCKEPLKPELPAGKADTAEMDKAGKEVEDYAKKMKNYRDCLVKCVTNADNDLSAVISGWNYAVGRYKERGK